VNQMLSRSLSRLLFQKQHKAPTLFIGTAAQVKRLKDWLAPREALGIQPIGFLTEDTGLDTGSTNFPFLGVLNTLARVIEEKMVAQVIVLDMPRNPGGGRFIIETCQDLGCRLLIYSNLGEQLNHPLVPVIEEGHAFFSLQEEPLEDPLNRVLKRCFDIAVSLPVVVLILPVLCLWVRLVQWMQAPGPLFFVQRRSGQRGNQFNIFKFRSMYDGSRVKEAEAIQAQREDNRVYPFGHFLRQSSLDEFPQFWNVLRGEMSIVGPRPHMPVHDAEFSRYYRGYRTRHFAKPGITGLAQIRGFRGEIVDPGLLQQRVNNDLHYISNWSVWLDLQITCKTLWQVLFPPKTAY
jgi:exopolysaccharide biosynthesis polyprenyl glycosylphosphotransferase